MDRQTSSRPTKLPLITLFSGSTKRVSTCIQKSQHVANNTIKNTVNNVIKNAPITRNKRAILQGVRRIFSGKLTTSLAWWPIRRQDPVRCPRLSVPSIIIQSIGSRRNKRSLRYSVVSSSWRSTRISYAPRHAALMTCGFNEQQRSNWFSASFHTLLTDSSVTTEDMTCHFVFQAFIDTKHRRRCMYTCYFL